MSEPATNYPELLDLDPVSRRRAAAFPVDALPEAFRSMVLAVAEATQTDPAMPAVTALTVLAAAAGGRAEVEARPGWREPLGLYTVTVAAPGERKSAVQSIMTNPLLAAEAELAEAGAARRVETETLKQIAIKEAERARAAASSAPDRQEKPRLQAEAISMAQVAESMEVPAIPRIVADDVTPEAAGSLLASQGGRLAIISSEGGIFEIMAGRYNGNVPSLDLWLKGHSGDPIKVDRKGREPEYIRRPSLTVGLMVQPTVLAAIGHHQTFRGRGLLARFLFSEPVSKVGRRKAGADPVPEGVRDRYEKEVRELVHGLAGWTDPAILLLTVEAAEELVILEAAVEPTLADDGELAALADWGSKFVGAVLRIAALLHLAEHGHGGVKMPVAVSTIHAATRIGHYFKTHAVRAFSSMQMDPTTADAIYLVERLRKMDGPVVSRRDLFNTARGRFKAVNDMDPAVSRLIDHGYLIPQPQPETRSAGRPPSPTFEIHPSLYADHAESAQTRGLNGSGHSAECA